MPSPSTRQRLDQELVERKLAPSRSQAQWLIRAGRVALDGRVETRPGRRVAPTASIVALIKPQFEAGPERVGRDGVVRDPAVRQAVLEELLAWASGQGLKTVNLTPSPILGGDGNREFLVRWR